MRSSRLSSSLLASLVVHGVLLLILAVAIGRRAASSDAPATEVSGVVFVRTAGPGGGGGGSPGPAPPRPLEIPRPLERVPVSLEPVVAENPPAVPTLNAPVFVTTASVLQASGRNLISLSPLGGGGPGRGVGPGAGPGVGLGERGGFGGELYGPGTPGFIPPKLIRSEQADYTDGALRAKIQGDVELEAVVRADGTVGDARIVKSIDSRYGLDQEAIRAAKLWVFQPATVKGAPVPTVVTIVLSFRLH